MLVSVRARAGVRVRVRGEGVRGEGMAGFKSEGWVWVLGDRGKGG